MIGGADGRRGRAAAGGPRGPGRGSRLAGDQQAKPSYSPNLRLISPAPKGFTERPPLPSPGRPQPWPATASPSEPADGRAEARRARARLRIGGAQQAGRPRQQGRRAVFSTLPPPTPFPLARGAREKPSFLGATERRAGCFAARQPLPTLHSSAKATERNLPRS